MRNPWLRLVAFCAGCYEGYKCAIAQVLSTIEYVGYPSRSDQDFGNYIIVVGCRKLISDFTRSEAELFFGEAASSFFHIFHSLRSFPSQPPCFIEFSYLKLRSNAMATVALTKVDRQSVVPFHLKLFYKNGAFHRYFSLLQPRPGKLPFL
jgi:hypothetical protein